MKPTTIEEYIVQYDGDLQNRLEQIYSVIKATAPNAEELIAYAIPTFKLGGKNLIHFGAGKHHIGLYPSPEAVEYFSDKLEGYKTSRGTIQFQNNEPLPLELIRDITKHRVEVLDTDTFPMK